MENNEKGYIIDETYDFIIEERGNSLMRLAKVSWFDRPAKLELRKWIVTQDGDVIPNKGVAFSDEESPSILVHKLIELGYGDDSTIKNLMEQRGVKLNINVESSVPVQSSNGYFDPSEIVN